MFFNTRYCHLEIIVDTKNNLCPPYMNIPAQVLKYTQSWCLAPPPAILAPGPLLRHPVLSDPGEALGLCLLRPFAISIGLLDPGLQSQWFFPSDAQWHAVGKLSHSYTWGCSRSLLVLSLWGWGLPNSVEPVEAKAPAGLLADFLMQQANRWSWLP